MPSSSSLPLSLSQALRSLPTVPGVYFFKDAAGKIIYVGKAKNLKNRVRSYFQSPAQLGPKTRKLVSQIASLEHIEVFSEFEALLLESRLIKKHYPQYNIASKDDKSPYYIHLTKESAPRPVVNHQAEGSLAGPFLSGFVARQVLKQFRRIAPFCSAPRPVKKPCLYSHLGLCRPCPGASDFSRPAYLAHLRNLKSLLSGKFIPLKNSLARQMQTASKSEDFETAAQLRDQLNYLDHLLKIPVSPDEYLVNPNLVDDTRQAVLQSLLEVLTESGLHLSSLNRIELYDNAHLQGDSPASAMVVAVNGNLSPRDYRHFTLNKLKTTENRQLKTGNSGNDIGYMQEVLIRRLSHSDWPKPDLIVLDGGLPQLSVVKNLPTAYSSTQLIPIIGLAKQFETLVFPDGRTLNLPKHHPGLLLLMRLRDEAHRFSRRLHHKHRSRQLRRH